jgi:hypothetical protein
VIIYMGLRGALLLSALPGFEGPLKCHLPFPPPTWPKTADGEETRVVGR